MVYEMESLGEDNCIVNNVAYEFTQISHILKTQRSPHENVQKNIGIHPYIQYIEYM
jgi:hypothetical protein